MELHLDVEGEKFTVSVGHALGDFVWLATYGAKLYGNSKYPKGNYLPTLLRIDHTGTPDSVIPHPRTKIKSYLSDNGVDPKSCRVLISLRKPNHHFIELERIWQRQAFGKQRELMSLRFKYFADKINRKKEFYFSVEISYRMHEEVKHLFKEAEYPKTQELRLVEQVINPTQSEFNGEMMLPLGQVSYCLLYYSKEDKNDDFKAVRLDESTLKQNPKNVFTAQISPQIISRSAIADQVKQLMRIQEGISKSLEQKQQQTKKKSNNTALCCYTFQQLWAAIQQHDKKIMLSKFQQSTINKVKVVLEQHMSKLYEVFSNYFIVHNQQREKKEDLVITFQDVMHCIKFYGILQDSEVVANFFDYYNMDSRIKSVSDTLNLANGVKFPQFLCVLLKVTQFIQTISLMKGSETFDKSVESVIGSIIAKEADEANQEVFTQFHRNLREQIKLIAFFREHSSQFASVFIHQIEDSIQTPEETYYLMKEELKVLLKLAGVEGDYDQIVRDCYSELFPDREKQQRFEDGIYFYEFIQVVQWLALVLIESKQEVEEDEEEQMSRLIDNTKFLLSKFAKHK